MGEANLSPNEQLVQQAYVEARRRGGYFGRRGLTHLLKELGTPLSENQVKRILKGLRGKGTIASRSYGDSRPAALDADISPTPPAPLSDQFVAAMAASEHPAAGECYAENGNEAQLTAVRPTNPRTLEELVAACEIDLDTWHIERWICNKWGQAAKIRTEKGGPQQIIETPLYQIKVWLVRRVAKRVHSELPALQPVYCTAKALLPSRRPTAASLQAGVVIPDPHIGFRRDTQTGKLTPFQDRRAIAAVLELVRQVQPQRVVVLGDLCDLPEFSDKFLRSPEFFFSFQPTLYEAGWLLAQLRALAPEAEIDLIPGNHDSRLHKAILAHLIFLHGIKPANAPNARPLLSWENLLGLDALRITCHDDYPQGKVWWNRKLVFRHGEELSSTPGGTVGKTLKQGNARSDGYGHTHRVEQAFRTSHDFDGPTSYSATSFGTLADIAGPIPSFSGERDWQNGCGVVWFDQHDHQTDLLHIQQGRIAWRGEWIEGKDYRQQLSRDTGWEF